MTTDMSIVGVKAVLSRCHSVYAYFQVEGVYIALIKKA